jgi:hypothetical protein
MALMSYPLVLTAMIGFFTWCVVSIHRIEIWQAATQGNRFTAGDFIKAREVLDARDQGQADRILRIETGMDTLRTDAQNASVMASKNHDILQQLLKAKP